jgi:hypothetical protein
VAAGIFAKFPQVKKIKSALVFVVSKEFVKADHDKEKELHYVAQVMPDIIRIESALKTNVWNPVSGPLCKFCAVKDCEYNRS